jgi:hypothetical protein
VNYTEAVRLLLAAAMHVTPTGKEQAAFSRMVNTPEQGATDKDIARALAGSIWDGLTYGNWPKDSGS